MKYIIGFIVIAVGFLLVWKSYWLVNNIGTIEWAETHLGSEGGTNLLYKIIGVLLILGTFMTLTGAIPALLTSVFGSSFGG